MRILSLLYSGLVTLTGTLIQWSVVIIPFLISMTFKPIEAWAPWDIQMYYMIKFLIIQIIFSVYLNYAVLLMRCPINLSKYLLRLFLVYFVNNRQSKLRLFSINLFYESFDFPQHWFICWILSHFILCSRIWKFFLSKDKKTYGLLKFSKGSDYQIRELIYGKLSSGMYLYFSLSMSTSTNPVISKNWSL